MPIISRFTARPRFTPGRAPRFARRRAARALRSAGAASSLSCLAGRLDLFGLLQAQLELFLGQGLGPPAKAMPLQLLDDLAQPLAFRPLSQQHRLEHVGVVGESFDGGRHEAD